MDTERCHKTITDFINVSIPVFSNFRFEEKQQHHEGVAVGQGWGAGGGKEEAKLTAIQSDIRIKFRVGGCGAVEAE